MAISSFKKIRLSDPQLEQFQYNASVLFKQISQKEILDGVRLTDLALTTADTYINHKLGREPMGWVVLRKNANADIWESATTNNLQNKQIILKASATVTCDLWFF